MPADDALYLRGSHPLTVGGANGVAYQSVVKYRNFRAPGYMWTLFLSRGSFLLQTTFHHHFLREADKNFGICLRFGTQIFEKTTKQVLQV